MKAESNNNTTSKTFISPFLSGAGISLLISTAFILSVQHPKPTWGSYWQIRPLILGPIITGIGMIIAYSILKYMSSRGISNFIRYPIAILLFVMSLWISMVLGFKGTLWN